MTWTTSLPFLFFLIWPYLLFEVRGNINSGEVSFFGSSHVRIKLQEARSSSDIYFRLRTRRSDSMLFLAAGRTDYCLLVLDAGRLKVHINLGAGETEIASEAPFLLNDMKWHTVNLTRRGSQLTIQVDDHFTKFALAATVKGYSILNIHFGVWLGGLAGFNEIFLGNLPSFRGCMSNITYNSEDVLLRAKTQPGEISGVSWNCSEEFDAITTDPFSFKSPSSYVISRAAIPRQGTVVKMNVRPVQEDGLIFYVSGVSSRPDYLALELREGKAHFVAEMGSGPIHIRSTTNITDHQWHSITIHASPSLLSVMIDNQTWTSESPARGASRHLDVSEVVYLGGVEDSKQNKLRSLGLIDQSFAGCISAFRIDGNTFGLPEVDISRNVTTGCSVAEPKFMSQFCSSNNASTTISSSNCTSVEVTVVSNSSDTSPITSNVGVTNNGTRLSRENSTILLGKGGSPNSLDVITIPRDVIRIMTQTAIGELEIMRLSPVQVAEGDSVIITPRHLAITLDLSKFGIRESGVLFRVSKPPHEGRVEVTSRAVSPSRSETFAFLDVGAGRVRYFHSGSETFRDSIELVLRLVQTKGFLLPAYLQDERVLTLPVEVVPVNDPPEIRLVPGGVLRLAEGTKIRLLPEVITALDPDTPAKDLHFTLMSIGAAGETTKGFLELSSEPGKAIQSFTQEDLLNQRVWYVDRGQSSSKMLMKVTDESSVSPTAVLRIETFSLRIAPEINTGLEVANVLGVTALISNYNLSFTSNAGDQGLIIEYHVVKSPRSGSVQLKRTNGQWTNVEHFTQLDILNKAVRYLLQRPSDNPTEDEFTFHVSLSQVKVPSEFRFRFRIISLRVEQGGLNTLILNRTTESLISTRQLEYRTFPVSTSDSELKYTIVQQPRYGFLFFRLSPESKSFQNNITNILTTFTQADLSSKRVFFKFHLTPYSPLNDLFLFNISTSHLSEGPFQCHINHYSQLKPLAVTLKPIIVTEGTRQVITSSILQIKISEVFSASSLSPLLFFNITSPPANGVVGVKSESKVGRMSSSVSHFTNSELEKGLVFYQHDGSESSKDIMPFVAWSLEANFIYEAQLEVIVKGVNNHSPIRAPSASLAIHVVFAGRKKLSRNILDYVDKDWDSERDKLKYTYTSVVLRTSSMSSSNGFLGNIYDKTVSLSQPVFTWTQADIDAGKLIFQHEGSETHGFLHFWVSDSKFTVNGTLEISAGAPWVRIVNTTTLAGRRGSMERLRDESIRAETNVDVDQERLLIRIVGGPQHGIIRMNNKAVLNFTLDDMSNGLVAYENEAPSDIQRDSFRFQAVVDGVVESDIAEFDVAIYPEAYWTPLSVGLHDSVIVNENSSAVISQARLHVINPHIPPSHIVYTLTRPPRNGYLAIDPTQSFEMTDDYVTIWDQTVINDGRLRYVQSEPNKTLDSMNFDVTNGVHTVRDLRLDFLIVPTTLLLASNTVVVNEGSSVGLNITHLHSVQNYFADKLAEVRIIVGPKHGTLSRPHTPLLSFPYKALEDGKIVYTHDGSETLLDHITVIVQTLDIESGEMIGNGNDERKGNSSSFRISHPHKIIIQILPSNDQVPKVVNNTGTWVWAGSSVVINNAELAAVDDDSDRNELIFYVVGMRGGFPAHADQPEKEVNNFTQEAINRSKIIFVHNGQDMKGASFDFEVSDGLNEANKEGFKISIRKPELVEYEGRVRLAVFPLTQAPLKPENLLVRSNDGREINFQASSGPAIGQLLIERSENNFSPVSAFTQTDVNNGKIFYQHLKVFRGQRANDSIRFTATSRYSDPLYNVTVEIDISVNGAALGGGLQRYVSIHNLSLEEGSQVAITSQNVNLSAVIDFINMHHKGSLWRGGTPSLQVMLSEVPRNGWLLGQDGSERLRSGVEISLQLLSNGIVKYVHDDSETTEDSIGFSLWFWTNDTSTSTWLLNVTLPIHIIPVNDQSFQISLPKGPLAYVVQEHWRKLSRLDLLTSDPDTPPSHLVYEVSNISHGRFLLVSPDSLAGRTLTSPTSGAQYSSSDNYLKETEDLKELPTIVRFTQADVDAGRVIFYHSGSVSPALISLRVTDGQFPPSTIILKIPIQSLTLQSSQNQASPVRIQQGKSITILTSMNLPASTNGQLIRLTYNITRSPLHGKILLRDRSISNSLSPHSSFQSNPHFGKIAVTFTHYELLNEEVAYFQTDLSVANDSFEVSAHITLESAEDEWSISTRTPKTKQVMKLLANVVAVPLLKKIKEVRSFVKGFAVGGIIAPDESEFSASIWNQTTMNLAVLDASPLATLTGANPLYEILLPPKFGQILKRPYEIRKQEQIKESHSQGNRYRRSYSSNQNYMGRIVSRFSHEDIRLGLINYAPSTKMPSNDILPFDLTSSSSSSMADEFIFKVLAPGVQPALGIAKFNLRTHDSRYYDEKTHNQIISDGSTDPATKRSTGDTMRDLLLVTPNLTKESLITVGVIIVGVLTLTLFLVVGIRCTCSKKRNSRRNFNNANNQGLNNGTTGNSGGNDTKCNGIGIIDVYAPSTTCTLLDPSCQSDSDCGHVHSHSLHGHGSGGLRPLLLSPLSQRSRHKVGNSRTTSESGSWTSSGLRTETPSIPQCRVTPLCGGVGSDSGGYSTGNIMMLCPLLPPTPICDTFAPLPEEIDPPEPYGFTYGTITNSLPQPLDIQERNCLEEETQFNEFHNSNHPVSNIMLPGSNNTSSSGTLRRNNNSGKNQYWV